MPGQNENLTPIIPADATEEIEKLQCDGAPKSAAYYLHGTKIGVRVWDEDGSISMEYGLKGEIRHGPFRTWYNDGTLFEETFYVEGKEHGVARQFDHEGRLIGKYTMEHGTGADFWYSARGVLSEERYYDDGDRVGYERWWTGDNATIWSEEHYKAGIAHGIFREWNQHGRLSRGYPQYYVDGKKVNKRQYVKACERDESLPGWREEENAPRRPLPRDRMCDLDEDQ